ncbi:MAG: hypothetical protein AABX52_02830, partial [Nanoarchaeota archaeon]
MTINPSDIVDITNVVLILLGVLLIALFVRTYIIKKILKLVARTKTTLDDYIIPSFTKPFIYSIILASVFISAKTATRLSLFQTQIDEAGIIALIIWAAYTSIKILHGIATWYF